MISGVLQGSLSLSGELPAAAMAATAAEEKPILSLFDKLRGKRRTSVDSSMVPKAAAHRLSLDGGTEHCCKLFSSSCALTTSLACCPCVDSCGSGCPAAPKLGPLGMNAT